MVHKDLQERKDLWVHKDQLGAKALQDRKGPKGFRVQEPKAHKEVLDFRVLKELQEPKVLRLLLQPLLVLLT